jgi:hypothetical protein
MTDDERLEYIRHVARLQDITLPPEEMPRVGGVFANLERLAGLLRDLPQPDEEMAAAVFRAAREAK